MSSPGHSASLLWFRRDLRDYDHAALYHALRRSQRVFCAFVFDRDILAQLQRRSDRRVEFILDALRQLDRQLRAAGGGLIVRHGRAVEEIPRLARQLGVAAVFANEDYEPSAKQRDREVAGHLITNGIDCHFFKDQVIFAGDEVLTQAGKPYSVFTPYKNAWLKKLNDFYCQPYPVQPYRHRLAAPPPALDRPLPSLAELGFAPSGQPLAAGMDAAQALQADFLQRIEHYQEWRDFPAIKDVSYLSVHLRFGTLSIRELVAVAWRHGGAGANTWLSELIWRDFYFMILDHFPQVVAHAFRPEYDAIDWAQRPDWLAAWQQGQTGYPLVDAAMRQLLHSGYMHNRLRMVVASFLCKDLGLDWRLGEAWFAEQLNDFDLAANNGGWQWAASSGCDAQPWFRIFNPVTQSEKFDPQGRFIRRYVPELAAVPERYLHAPWRMTPLEQEACGVRIGRDYPAPLVDHAVAREETLRRYAIVKKN
jgi:deoxyribodipyrimidine photo-lyase